MHVSYIHIDSISKPLLTSVGSGGPQLFMREFIMLLRVFSSIINVPQFESVILLIKSGKTKKGTYKHHRSWTLISVCEYIWRHVSHCMQRLLHTPQHHLSLNSWAPASDDDSCPSNNPTGIKSTFKNWFESTYLWNDRAYSQLYLETLFSFFHCQL